MTYNQLLSESKRFADNVRAKYEQQRAVEEVVEKIEKKHSIGPVSQNKEETQEKMEAW